MNDAMKAARVSIVTARNAPAHERMMNTLKHEGIEVDELFLTGGIEKKNILDVLKPKNSLTISLVAWSTPQKAPNVSTSLLHQETRANWSGGMRYERLHIQNRNHQSRLHMKGTQRDILLVMRGPC